VKRGVRLLAVDVAFVVFWVLVLVVVQR